MTIAEAVQIKPSPYAWVVMNKEIRRPLSLLDIEYHVCKYFGLNVEDIHVKTRKKDIVCARQIAQYFQMKMVKGAGCSLIARHYNQDHTSVIHSIKAVKNHIDVDEEYNFIITELTQQLNKIAKK